MSPENSLIAEFHLYCNKQYLVAWISSCIFVGNMLSSAVYPFFIDRHGRKYSILLSATISGTSLVLAGFSFSATLRVED